LGELAAKKSEIYKSFIVNVDTEYFKALKKELSKSAIDDEG